MKLVLPDRDVAVHEGTLVRLRAFEPEDAERYRRWVNDPAIGRLIDRVGPVTPAEHEAWYRTLVASPTAAAFAVDRLADGRFIGLVWLYDIHPLHRRAEVRIVIGERSAWGGGYGTDALRVLQRIGFGPLGLEKLWADVLTTNPRAARAFERAGFKREGLLEGDRAQGAGRVDVIRLGILRDPARV
jgi:[ribosomal protein S5]-alanine N-acetyltransferase